MIPLVWKVSEALATSTEGLPCCQLCKVRNQGICSAPCKLPGTYIIGHTCFVVGHGLCLFAVLLNFVVSKCAHSGAVQYVNILLLDVGGDDMHSAAEVCRLQQELELLRLKDLQQEHHIHVLTQQLRSVQAEPSQVL